MNMIGNSNTSFKDHWESVACHIQLNPMTQKQPRNKRQVEKVLSHLLGNQVPLTLIDTLKDETLQRALQTCLTFNKTDCRHRKLSLPMFSNEYDMTEELFWVLDYAEEIISSWGLQLLAGWSDMRLLIFSWLSHVKIAKALLDKDAPATTKDNDGRTASPACAASIKMVEQLLKYDVNPCELDSEKCTPLHYAAAAGCVVTMKSLIKSGANIDVELFGRSPLHYAVLNNAVDCVEALLQANACPNLQTYIGTPLHVAASLGNICCTKLLLSYGADVNVQLLQATMSTPLHLAAERGSAECTKLLLNAGAALEMKNSLRQTAMHLAVHAQSVETLDTLICAGASVDAKDDNERTPLHVAVAEELKDNKLIKNLIKAGASINAADKFGYTPLHIAALNQRSQTVMMLLLNRAANVTARTKGGITALDFIVRRTPDVLPYFKARLDDAISLRNHKLGDVDCELELDFMPLMPHDLGEADLMFCLKEVGQGDVLQHPLCESFLHLKWLCIRKYFLLSLILQLIFVILFTGYVCVTYMYKINWLYDVFFWSLLSITCIFTIKEIFQISHIYNYTQRWENWLQWSVIVMSSVTLCSVKLELKKHPWLYHVAALGILLIWIELMRVIGRFPMFGIYIQMFTLVSINFFKCFAAYICLIIGFAFSFSVLSQNYKSLKNPLFSLLKAIIMMSGELEFEDIFFPEDKNVTEHIKKDNENELLLYSLTTHLIFLSFVVLVTIILTNLMMGLAVSDIQELRKCAGRYRLMRHAEQMAHFENYFENMLDSKYVASILRSKFLHRIPIMNRIIQACKKDLVYPTVVYIRPNDPYEKLLPRELIKAVYRLVSERR